MKNIDDFETRAALDEARFVKNTLGDSRKAIKLCDEILKQKPANRDAMLIKAGAFGEIFELDKAEALIKKIIQKWPEHWEGYYLYAINCFSRNEDEEGFEMINKSIELDENFDNIITKAQMLHLSGREGSKEYVEKARKIDRKRAEKFMKTAWINDEKDVQPTFEELFNAVKEIIRKKLL